MSVIICKTLRAIIEKGIKRQICSIADNKKNIHCELQSSWLAKALTDFALIKDILLSRDLNTVDYLTCLTDAWSSLSESLSLMTGKSVISCKHVWECDWSVWWICYLDRYRFGQGPPTFPCIEKLVAIPFLWVSFFGKGISSCCFAAPREDENVQNGKHPQKNLRNVYIDRKSDICLMEMKASEYKNNNSAFQKPVPVAKNF